MSPPPDNLRDALRALEVGELDALTPEQVAQLEHVLNRTSAGTGWASRVAAPNERLRAALAKMDADAAPSPTAWKAVWQRIEAAAPMESRAAGRGPLERVLRLWRPLAAVAACLLFVVVWRGAPPPDTDDWPLQLAADVEINELEVYDGGMPMILNIGGAHGPEVIWVLQAQDEG